MPFRSDEGLYEEEFIEERRKGLEQFVNKVAGHPLAQNERCLHMFLQDLVIDKNYVPGTSSLSPPLIVAVTDVGSCLCVCLAQAKSATRNTEGHVVSTHLVH